MQNGQAKCAIYNRVPLCGVMYSVIALYTSLHVHVQCELLHMCSDTLSVKILTSLFRSHDSDRAHDQLSL